VLETDAPLGNWASNDLRFPPSFHPTGNGRVARQVLRRSSAQLVSTVQLNSQVLCQEPEATNQVSVLLR
jgi:hypothetical protein